MILALGIGATTTIFTLINSILLRPPPYQNPHELVFVTEVMRNGEAEVGCFSYPQYKMMLEHVRIFSGLAAFSADSLNMSGRGEAEQLAGARVAWNFFQILGVRPALGRGFVADEEQAADQSAVIISDSLWKRRFHRRLDILGQGITLNARSYTIVGVLPASFAFDPVGNHIDIWAPQLDQISLITPEQARSGVCFLNAVGRVARGVSQQQAAAHLAVFSREYRKLYPTLPDASPKNVLEAAPLQEQMVGHVRATFLVLFGAVCLVLTIACANVAALQLVRALARKKELAIRTALGATHSSLLMQSVVESLLLTLAGGVLGSALGIALLKLCAASMEDLVPRTTELQNNVDVRFLCFSFGVALLTGVLVGLVPALQLSRFNIMGDLREEGRGTVGSLRGGAIRSLLVVGQVALSVCLLVGSGLMIRSFLHLRMQPCGFEPSRLLTMNVSLPSTKYQPGQMTAFFEQALERIRVLPGVRAAAGSSALPANPARFSPFLAEGQASVPVAERPVVSIQMITPSYLAAMGIPLIRGREFTVRDRRDSIPVAVINRALAQRYFPGQDVLGKHVYLGRRSIPCQVVGVVGDIRNISLATEAKPEIMVPFAQLPWPSLNLLIRTRGNPTDMAEPVRRQLQALDPDQPATSVQTMDELLANEQLKPKLTTLLLASFALCALVLAVVGIYGVISYSVSQRTRELGLRMALGATRQSVLTLVMKQGLRLAGWGIAVGLALSFAGTRLLSTLLYGVTATDALTFAASPCLFLGFAVLASVLPALRATRVDPLSALRDE